VISPTPFEEAVAAQAQAASNVLKAGELYWPEWVDGKLTGNILDRDGNIVASVPVVTDVKDLWRAWE
jgi:hypothetical protein